MISWMYQLTKFVSREFPTEKIVTISHVYLVFDIDTLEITILKVSNQMIT